MEVWFVTMPWLDVIAIIVGLALMVAGSRSADGGER